MKPTSQEQPWRTAMLTAFVALSFTVAQAQVTPTPPMPPTTLKDASTMQQTPPKGWVMFDDQVGKDLGLDQDRLDRLREVDNRYRAEYDALGKDPLTNKGYSALSDRRNADVKGILSADQYNAWITRYNTPPPTPQRSTGSDMSK